MNTLFVLLLVTLAAGAWASKSKPTCGEATDSKNFQLLSPNSPPRECRYRVKAHSKRVCQLRLDFSMVLAQPSLPGTSSGIRYVECVNDYLQVGGLKFCGVENNQHIYLPLNRSDGETHVDLEIILAQRGGGNKLPTPSWSIAITQLECPSGSVLRQFNDDADQFVNAKSDEEHFVKPEARASSNDGFLLAPNGCLQYYPEPQGDIYSFNYNGGNGIYPGNMNYAICFRRTRQTRTLELQTQFFNLGSNESRNNVLLVDEQCYPHFRVDDSNEDYLMVPQSIVEDSDLRATYFCGNSLQSGTLRSTNPGPIMMVFNSDGYVKGNEAGFAFSYNLLDF